MDVPFLDLQTHHRELADEIMPLWREILETAAFVGGPHISGFEQEFAAACGTAHAVAVNSGTDALRFAFMALGLKPGDEVITVPNTFIATTEAITQAGGIIRFVDIDPETYNLNPGLLKAAITPKTRGIVPVHLYGQPADMDPILAIAREHGLWVVEDACQAHLAEYKGGKAGAMGEAGAFSFYPGKNLGACGEAGAVTTNDEKLAARVRMIRDHGQAQKYYHDIEGYNGRCDALQAAAMRVKLKHLAQRTQARRRAAARYLDQLAGNSSIVAPKTMSGAEPVWHLFVIQVEQRDDLQKALKDCGVATALHYPVPLHLQKAYAGMGLKEGSFPVAEKVSRRLLSLPMFPELTNEQIDFVCASLAAAV